METESIGNDELRRRTKKYALRIMRLVESLPDMPVARAIGKQLLDCGTSVGANYRAACRPKSLADFIAKMGIVEEETDESLYWMELLVEAGIMEQRLLADLMREGDEILSMTVSSIRTAKANRRQQR
jgi:four helix bundle protein